MDRLAAPGFGLPTSTGDLPFDDHLTAVEFTLLAQPAFPTVPRLTSLGCSLTHQVASFIPGATVSEPGLLELPAEFVVDPAATPDTSALDQLTGPFEGVAEFLEIAGRRSMTSDESFVGVRIDVLGPISTALALRASGLGTADAMALGIEIASLSGERLLSHLRSHLDTALIAVVMDEPALVGAMHPTFPLLSHEIHGALAAVVNRIDRGSRGTPVLIGAHVPGRTDWSTVIASGVSLLSVPLGGNLEGYADHLTAFLDAGGMVAWGAVPVDEPLGGTDEILWRRLSMFWCSLVGEGVDPFQVRSQSLMSTSDGLSHFAENQLDHISNLIDSLSTRVHRQAAGTRLSLGA